MAPSHGESRRADALLHKGEQDGPRDSPDGDQLQTGGEQMLQHDEPGEHQSRTSFYEDIFRFGSSRDHDVLDTQTYSDKH